jgi:hypothetical protein
MAISERGTSFMIDFLINPYMELGAFVSSTEERYAFHVSVALSLMNIKRHLNTMRFVYVPLI